MTQRSLIQNDGDGEMAVSLQTVEWLGKKFNTVEEAHAWITENISNVNVELWDVEKQIKDPFTDKLGQCMVFYKDRGDDGNSKNL